MATPITPEQSMRLGTVRQLSKEQPGLTESAIRALIHKSQTNGLAPHVHRIGRRVLVDLNGFQTWVKGQQEGAR